MSVAFGGCLWGSLMFLWSIDRLRETAKLRDYFIHAFAWALMGLCFGIATTFKSKTIRPPLVYVLVAAFVAAVVMARVGRRKLQGSKARTAT